MKYIPIILIIALASCSTTKHSSTQVATLDSTAAHVRDSAVREISRLKASYTKQISALKQSKVTFAKPAPCPPAVNTGEGCSYDSLVAAIRHRDNYIASLRNTVTVYKDGSVKYEGQIAAITQRAEQTENEASELQQALEKYIQQHEADSMALIKASSATTKDVKKRSGLPVLWWLWFIAAAYIFGRYQKQIISKLRL